MATSLLSLSLLAILVAAGIRYHEVGLRHAGPFGMPPLVWVLLSSLCLGVLCFRLPTCLRRRSPRAMEWPELAIVPGLYFLLWSWLPSGDRLPVHWIVIAVLLTAIAVPAARDPDRGGIWGSRRDFVSATILLAPPTLLLFGLAQGVGRRVGAEPELGRVLLSLLSYPLYAFLQLALFFGLVVSRLRRAGAADRTLVLVPALLFSLAHWPNGVLMVATLVAGGAWAWVYRRHPSLLALALSMAVLATAYTQLMPERFSAHARVGPSYVFKAHLREFMLLSAEQTERCASELFSAPLAPDAEAFVEACLRELLHRNPGPAELRDWTDGWLQAWREETAGAILLARNHDLAWGKDEAELRERGRRWSSQAIWSECGEDWERWLERFFDAESGRAYRPGDLDHWAAWPGPEHRRALVRSIQRTEEYLRVADSPAWRCSRLGPWLPPGEEFHAPGPEQVSEFRLSQRIRVSRPTKVWKAESSDSTE